MNKYFRTDNWVGHSKLKGLYYNNVFDRKQMIEYLESDLTGAPIDASNTNNVALSEVKNDD